MLEVIRHQLPVKVKPELEAAILKDLAPSFSPYFLSIKKGYWEKFGLDFKEDFPFDFVYLHQPSYNAGGDVFFLKGRNILFFKIPSNRLYIETGFIKEEGYSEEEYNNFQQAIRKVILSKFTKLKPQVVKWQPIKPVNEHYKHMVEELPKFLPTDADYQAAAILEDESIKKLLLKVKVKGSSLLNDIVEDKDRNRIPFMVPRLEELGLVTREFAIFCRITNQQISRVPSAQAIGEASRIGIKCTHCGKPISEERIEQLVSYTPYAENMLGGDYWMVIRLLDILKRMSIPEENILITATNGIGSRKQVLNIFLNFDNTMVMFELKNENFTLSDSFLFNLKGSIYNPDHGIIISSDNPHPNVINYFKKNENGFKVMFINSFIGLEDKLKELFKENRYHYINSIFSDFVPLTFVDIENIYFDKVYGETSDSAPKKELSKEEEIAVAEAEEEAASVAEEAEETAEETVSYQEEKAPPAAQPKEAIISQILQELNEKGLSGQEEALASRLGQLASAGVKGSIIATFDGLPIVSQYNEPPGPEGVAAVIASIYQAMSPVYYKYTGSTIKHLEFISPQEHFFVGKTEPSLLITLTDDNSFSVAPAAVKRVAGEQKEAYLRRLVNDLVQDDNITGCSIATKEGLLFTSSHKEAVYDDNLLAGLSLYMLNIHQDYFNRLIEGFNYFIVSADKNILVVSAGRLIIAILFKDSSRLAEAADKINQIKKAAEEVA